MIRHDSRAPKELRKITIETNVFKHPEGSVVISFGDTKVICSATVEEKVPPFLRGGGTGWVAAEYSMLHKKYSGKCERKINRANNGDSTFDWAVIASCC